MWIITDFFLILTNFVVLELTHVVGMCYLFYRLIQFANILLIVLHAPWGTCLYFMKLQIVGIYILFSVLYRFQKRLTNKWLTWCSKTGTRARGTKRRRKAWSLFRCSGLKSKSFSHFSVSMWYWWSLRYALHGSRNQVTFDLPFKSFNILKPQCPQLKGGESVTLSPASQEEVSAQAPRRMCLVCSGNRQSESDQADCISGRGCPEQCATSWGRQQQARPTPLASWFLLGLS